MQNKTKTTAKKTSKVKKPATNQSKPLICPNQCITPLGAKVLLISIPIQAQGPTKVYQMYGCPHCGRVIIA